ncbi:hypothetical protein C8R44DRAFT_20564 [Mycena epipterygia]|nr:hypothetical protein C8R44DRAFT_20564 [Mycena epipterygia]
MFKPSPVYAQPAPQREVPLLRRVLGFSFGGGRIVRMGVGRVVGRGMEGTRGIGVGRAVGRGRLLGRSEGRGGGIRIEGAPVFFLAYVCRSLFHRGLRFSAADATPLPPLHRASTHISRHMSHPRAKISDSRVSLRDRPWVASPGATSTQNSL